MKLSRKVMLSEVPKLCLVLATLIGSACSSGACERRLTWWNRERSACVPCTRCEPNLAVKLPCELHRDTVCQPLHEIHIWPVETLDSNNDSEISDYEYYEDVEYSEVSDNGEVRWHIQTTTLALAASGCIVFFVVVLYVSFYHTKQWKVLKRALRSDVQDLSAKLKLMEAGEAPALSAKLKLMEAGETPAEPVLPADHHIYCNIHVAKDAFIGPPSAKKELGNVYTQEKHPY